MDKNKQKYSLTNPNPHLDPYMRDYVMDLWMRGVDPDTITRMVRRKISRERGWNKNNNDKNVA